VSIFFRFFVSMARAGYQAIQDPTPNAAWTYGAFAAVLGLATMCSYTLTQSLYAGATARQGVSTHEATTRALPLYPVAASISQGAAMQDMPDSLAVAAPSIAMKSQVGGPAQLAVGLGCLLSGALALMRLSARRIQCETRQDLEVVLATVTGDKETHSPVKRIPGIKARPAGYRHDVTRGYQLEDVSRPRRNRRHPAIRAAMRETQLSPANFIAPLFIHDEDFDTPIGAMPGCNRLCSASVLREIGECVEQGVNTFVLFPKIPEELKTPDGRQCYDQTDIVMRTLKLIKGAYPDVVVCTDVALDPYNTDGHDGIVDETTGVIMNDITVEQLCKQAVAQARAGADIVAPSDMQDGRIGAIRDALDGEGFTHVGIMSYCAKYASAFYGPFREALDSNPSFGDKSTYQMDPSNRREALREIELDEAEGADILMVKPALPYLDVIMTLRENSALPIAAYQVSGEYSMIKAAAQAGFIDEKKVVLESLLSIKRAGADFILTYFAKDAATWINDPKGWWRKRLSGLP